MSTLLDVTASIIQGSAIGRAAYVITAGDLVAAVPRNSLCKYVDESDTYVIIPASNEASRLVELDNVQRWTEPNNLLKLNCSIKSTEIVFRDSMRRSTYRCRAGAAAWNSAQQLYEDAGCEHRK